jgi:hypothetical protein
VGIVEVSYTTVFEFQDNPTFFFFHFKDMACLPSLLATHLQFKGSGFKHFGGFMKKALFRSFVLLLIHTTALPVCAQVSTADVSNEIELAARALEIKAAKLEAMVDETAFQPDSEPTAGETMDIHVVLLWAGELKKQADELRKTANQMGSDLGMN